MYARGHLGLSLLLVFGLYSLLDIKGEENLILGLLIVVFSTIPDIDLKLGIKHRGFTHTLYFGLILGLFLAFFFAQSIGFYHGFMIGFGSTLVHILGDMLTKEKFKPFWPFWEREFALGIVRSSDKNINNLLWTLGQFSFIFYILFTFTNAGYELIRSFNNIIYP